MRAGEGREVVRQAWYAEWLATGEERILQKILRYNLDDVRAMAVVDDGLRALVRG